MTSSPSDKAYAEANVAAIEGLLADLVPSREAADFRREIGVEPGAMRHADPLVGLGLSLSRQVPAETLADEAYTEGILPAEEWRLEGPERWAAFLRRADGVWIAGRLRERLAARDLAEGLLRIGTTEGERAVRHGASLVRVWLLAAIGRMRREERAMGFLTAWDVGAEGVGG